jgi:hypothetical protein
MSPGWFIMAIDLGRTTRRLSLARVLGCHRGIGSAPACAGWTASIKNRSFAGDSRFRALRHQPDRRSSRRRRAGPLAQGRAAGARTARGRADGEAQQRVTALYEALGSRTGNVEAIEAIRELIEKIVLAPSEGRLVVDLHGEAAAILKLSGKSRTGRRNSTMSPSN